jgi:hypothetical protein
MKHLQQAGQTAKLKQIAAPSRAPTDSPQQLKAAN